MDGALEWCLVAMVAMLGFILLCGLADEARYWWERLAQRDGSTRSVAP